MSPQTAEPQAGATVSIDPNLVLKRAGQVDDFFRVQLEKGLFCGEGADLRGREVADFIVEACRLVRLGQPEEALRNVIEAEMVLLDAFYKRPKIWRFFHRFQPILVTYYIFILLYLFILGSDLLQGWSLPQILLVPSETWGVPAQVLAFGAGGAILRGLYWLNFKVGQREFRPHFQLAYFIAPWIGALFGALVYVVVRAGLWTFQGGDGAIEEPWGVLGLAALAGYSWEWVTEWLSRVLKGLLTQRAQPAASSQEPPPRPPISETVAVPILQRADLPEQPAGDELSAAPVAELPDQPPQED
jgi:hypothetical protein